jgi:formate dehydrogenase subunit gamma
MPEDEVVDRAIAENLSREGALLPILHAVQDALGFIPPEALPRIAVALNISKAEVHGVVTFYHDFRTAPAGRHIVKVCRAEACQSRGSEALAEHVKAALGVDFKETRGDGGVTLEPVYCLGNCALGPSLMLDGRIVGRVTPERFERLVQEEMPRL